MTDVPRLTALSRSASLQVLLTPIGVGVALVAVLVYLQVTPARLGDQQVLNQRFVMSRLIQHLQIVALAFGGAALIALPFGTLLVRAGRVARWGVFLVANLGQALPSIGVLALGLTFFGIGIRGPVLALVLYALLPILRSTVLGLEQVDVSVRDAARGLGMSRAQILVRVEYPLAMPVIFAGLRVALVLVVGTATLANFIGGGGLGDLIAAGNVDRPRPLVAGAVMVSALAVLADWGMGLLERALTPKT